MENHKDKRTMGYGNSPKTRVKRSHSPEEVPSKKVCEHTLIHYPSTIASSSCDNGTSNPYMNVASTSSSTSSYFFMPSHDPSTYGMMTPIPYFYPMSMMAESMWNVPQKIVKTFSSCILYPPLSTDPPPSRRNKPNGCKTVFVGGLPSKITIDIIKEPFSECGEIETVRMSKKNFCHIRFTSEHHVDKALLISGYYIHIKDETGSSYRSRLHVDYAVASKDQREYECLKRAQFREARHATLKDLPPSPPPIANFSDYESDIIKKQLRNKDKERIKEAIQVLATWLKRGECNKRNAETFYSMVTSTFSQVKRLIAETEKMKLELKMEKDKLNKKFISNGAWFNDIESIFKYALMQKVSDHLTKAQRKQIWIMKNSMVETKKANLKDLLEGRVEDEMELSDDEEKESEDSIKLQMEEELSRLSEENAKLRVENKLLCNQSKTVDESEKKIVAFLDVSLKVVHQIFEISKGWEVALKEKLDHFRN